MNLYKGKYWDVIFGIWTQDHPGYCIISSKKEKLSDLTPEEWMELGLLEKELERVCNKVLKPTNLARLTMCFVIILTKIAQIYL